MLLYSYSRFAKLTLNLIIAKELVQIMKWLKVKVRDNRYLLGIQVLAVKPGVFDKCEKPGKKRGR